MKTLVAALSVLSLIAGGKYMYNGANCPYQNDECIKSEECQNEKHLRMNDEYLNHGEVGQHKHQQRTMARRSNCHN